MRALLFVLLVGCADPSGENTVVEIGKVERDAIAFPTTASVNVPIHVSITTDGGGCIEFESTDVAPTAAGFAITPFDREHVPSAGQGCTLELTLIDHGVDLTFPSAGTATILVHVRQYVLSGNSTELDDIDISQTVTVQ